MYRGIAGPRAYALDERASPVCHVDGVVAGSALGALLDGGPPNAIWRALARPTRREQDAGAAPVSSEAKPLKTVPLVDRRARRPHRPGCRASGPTTWALQTPQRGRAFAFTYTAEEKHIM